MGVFAALLFVTVTLIHDVTIIDPATRKVEAHRDVLLRGASIGRIAPAGSIPNDGAKVVEGTGRYLLPGFTDLHVHLFAHPWDDKGNLRPRYDRPTIEQSLRMLLAFGVTTIRDPGAETEAAVTLRDAVQRGALPGPEIVTCGRILNASDFDPEPFKPVHDETALRREIRWQKAAGADCIKIYSSMTPPLTKAAIEEAHALGLPLLGHLQRTTWTEAAQLGIDGVEHAAPWSAAYVKSEDRANYTEDMFGRVYWLEHLDPVAVDTMADALVAHHVSVDPTLIAMATKFFGDDPRWTNSSDLSLAPAAYRQGWAAASFTRNWTPAQYAASRKAWPLLLQLTKTLFNRGVLLTAGTDAPTPWIVPGPSLHDELLLLRDAGIPAMDVLRITTSNAAVSLRHPERGSIREGARADLVLLAADPLADLRNTRSIVLVFKAGVAYDPRELLRP